MRFWGGSTPTTWAVPLIILSSGSTIACGCRPGPDPITSTHEAATPHVPSATPPIPSVSASSQPVAVPFSLPFQLDLSCDQRARTKRTVDEQRAALGADCARGMSHEEQIPLQTIDPSRVRGHFDVPAGACLRVGVLSGSTKVEVKVTIRDKTGTEMGAAAGLAPLMIGPWCVSKPSRQQIDIQVFGARPRAAHATLWRSP